MKTCVWQKEAIISIMVKIYSFEEPISIKIALILTCHSFSSLCGPWKTNRNTELFISMIFLDFTENKIIQTFQTFNIAVMQIMKDWIYDYIKKKGFREEFYQEVQCFLLSHFPLLHWSLSSTFIHYCFSVLWRFTEDVIFSLQ